MWYLRIANSKGRKSYKIFADATDLNAYLDKNKDKSCESMQPLYIKENYQDFPHTKIKFLSQEEVANYISEQENF